MKLREEFAGPMAFALIKKAAMTVTQQPIATPPPQAGLADAGMVAPQQQQPQERPTPEQLLQQTIDDLHKSPVVSLFMSGNVESMQGNQRQSPMGAQSEQAGQQPQQKLAFALRKLPKLKMPKPKVSKIPLVGPSAAQATTKPVKMYKGV